MTDKLQLSIDCSWRNRTNQCFPDALHRIDVPVRSPSTTNQYPTRTIRGVERSGGKSGDSKAEQLVHGSSWWTDSPQHSIWAIQWQTQNAKMRITQTIKSAPLWISILLPNYFLHSPLCLSFSHAHGAKKLATCLCRQIRISFYTRITSCIRVYWIRWNVKLKLILSMSI